MQCAVATAASSAPTVLRFTGITRSSPLTKAARRPPPAPERRHRVDPQVRREAQLGQCRSSGEVTKADGAETGTMSAGDKARARRARRERRAGRSAHRSEPEPRSEFVHVWAHGFPSCRRSSACSSCSRVTIRHKSVVRIWRSASGVRSLRASGNGRSSNRSVRRVNRAPSPQPGDGGRHSVIAPPHGGGGQQPRLQWRSAFHGRFSVTFIPRGGARSAGSAHHAVRAARAPAWGSRAAGLTEMPGLGAGGCGSRCTSAPATPAMETEQVHGRRYFR